MNRRGFLGSILALAAAPAIVRADSLMRIVPVETVVIPAESALTEAALRDMIRRVWVAGGIPEVIRCSPEAARTLDGLAGVATRISSVADLSRVPSLSYYVSDYASSRIFVDPQLRAGDCIVESPEGYAQALLR